MIWQAFVDVKCEPDVTFDVSPCDTLALAKQQRFAKERHGPFRVRQDCRLRRVSWLLDPGVEADGELVWQIQRVVTVAVVGQDRSVSWFSPLDLPILPVGAGLFWRLRCSGLEGRAVFTFDFEALPRVPYV